MQGPNPLLDKTYQAASGAVTQYRIGREGTNDDEVRHASSSGQAYLGVIQHDAALGENVRLTEIGISKVEYGGNVAYNDPLTSDADGKAVKAAPSGGVNNYIIGWSRASGVAGDIGRVLITQGRIQG